MRPLFIAIKVIKIEEPLRDWDRNAYSYKESITVYIFLHLSSYHFFTFVYKKKTK